jgi:hypothetical protein
VIFSAIDVPSLCYSVVELKRGAHHSAIGNPQDILLKITILRI